MKHSTFNATTCATLRKVLALFMALLGWSSATTVMAQTPPEGLYMNKTWEATDEMGTQGYVTLEAFVTGSAIASSTTLPTDIVLVLDQSGSMAQNFSTTTYTERDYTNSRWYDNNRNNCYALVNDSYQRVTITRVNNGGWGNPNYTYTYSCAGQSFSSQGANTTPTAAQISTISSSGRLYTSSSTTITKLQALKNALNSFVAQVNAEAMGPDGILGTDDDVNHRVAVVGFASGNTNGQTYENTELFNGATQINYTNLNAGHYQAAFKDMNSTAGQTAINASINALAASGATRADLGMQLAQSILTNNPVSAGEDRARVVVMFTDGAPTTSTGFNRTVADDAINISSNIKNNQNAQVFAVGIFAGADASSPGTRPTGNLSDGSNLIPAASNWFMQTLSSNNGVPSTNPEAPGYYFAAADANELSNVFTTIASSISSVPVQMNSLTIVQDQLAPNFLLPAGASINSILCYTPSCTAVNTATTPYEYSFEAYGPSNQIPSSNAISIDATGTIIQFTGFDFTENWCGLEDNGHSTTVHGKKIVIRIPLVVEEGVWGDGLPTNGPLSVIFPNGDTSNPIGAFPIPLANIKGDVWSEIVSTEPQGFDPNNIDSPEDLAWFISLINGRQQYEFNNSVPANPTVNGRLTADLDMSRHNWIPIGSTGIVYQGTFDGNGHVVSGLKNNASKMYKQGQTVVVYPGMFGTVSGTVHDLFVIDSDFRAKHHDDVNIPHHYGIIVDNLTASGKLYNCASAGTLSTAAEIENANLIFGGLVGLNEGSIHSCLSMAELNGYQLGGAIGENRGSFDNSMANPVLNYQGNDNTLPVGGLVAISNASGTVSNTYLRFSRASSGLFNAEFGQLAGTGATSSFTNCYLPASYDPSVPAVGTAGATVYQPYSSPTLYNRGSESPLLEQLNAQATAHEAAGWAKWKRTTAGAYSEGAGDINGDYPVPVYNGYTCVGSTNGVALDYGKTLSDILKRHNEGAMNANTKLPQEGISGYNQAHHNKPNNLVYSVSEHPTIKGGSINLFMNTDNREGEVQNTADDVVVYIDENVSLLQGETSSITAYTCQTMKNYDDDERWHDVSSSLSGSGIGFIYGTDELVPHSWEPNPCGVTLSTNNDNAIFPHDAPVFSIDLYSFFEEHYHWINLKRNTLSHWHMDNYDENIAYSNETELIPGKGYLLAIDQEQLLQNRGTLNNGEINVNVTHTIGIESSGLQGYNLLGNPYQSYLDFDAFVDGNTNLWIDSDQFKQTYAVYDPSQKGYVQYSMGASQGSITASRYINMHQGFLVKVGKSGTATFTNAMRVNQRDSNTGFRGEQPSYPLVNLTMTDPSGNCDFAVLELGRDEHSGAEKLRVGNATGRIYLRFEGKDYAILFRDAVKDYQPLYFDANEDGIYTLSWSTANAQFRNLVLVDNITGQQYDMLNNDSYTFEGKADDYKSRFKILVGEYTGVEEQGTTNTSFAFFDGSEWLINGHGMLSVFDLMGREVYNTSLNNEQNRVSFSDVPKGVYLLRVMNNTNVKVQKIVVQ